MAIGLLVGVAFGLSPMLPSLFGLRSFAEIWFVIVTFPLSWIMSTLFIFFLESPRDHLFLLWSASCIMYGVLGAFVARALVPDRVLFPKPFCCSFCGYCLTGNTSGVCPECGTTVKSELDAPTRLRPPQSGGKTE